MQVNLFAAMALALSTVVAGHAKAEIIVEDAYARAAMPSAPTGAIFMTLRNDGPEDARLVSVESDAAAKTELHTHIAGEDGVMRMRPIEGGLVIPAGGSHALARGGDHVMLMGLTHPLDQGAQIGLTLGFESGEEIRIDVPVDLER
ncbi:copper chaperone PCu(A)C [Salipiger sp. CCB-MM3]|uniref:copper chaperone PCu(A)C n=1 Tax=Salipiger sp. CCB-MM3 TaxID=1792508 RepID=UPI000B0BC58D|nr:copper chaperone PCu(A)C [Salipiger sp. CCB-MM3]